VVLELCTGCELCIAPCPVDCITMVARAALPSAPPAPAPGANRARYDAHGARLGRRAEQRATLVAARKQPASPA
jgi:electron transport complex protein RnfB